MSNDFILNTVLGSVTAVCLAVTEIPAIGLTEKLTIIARICAILSFIIILVSNWDKFTNQIKDWFK